MMNSRELSHLVDLFLDRELSDVQAKSLLNRLAEEPEFKDRFVEEVVLCGMCHGLSADSEKEVNDVMETIRLGAKAPDVTALVMNDLREQRDETMALALVVAKNQQRSRKLVQRAIGLGIAACLAILMFFVFGNRDTQAIATISHIEGAKWGGESEPIAVGDNIGNERLDLRSGFVVLKFGDGVRVSIEGPANFHAVSLSRMKLDRGNITAHVNPAGVGFQVETEHGLVTDFGTTFEVSVEKGKATEVTVLEGGVTFKPLGVGSEQPIRAGKRIHVNGSDLNIELTDIIDRKKTHGRRLELLSGVRGKEGKIRMVSDWDVHNPKLIRIHKSLDVLPERRNLLPEGPVSVNVWESGEYTASKLQGIVVQKEFGDTRLDSFLIQFSPPTVEKGKKQAPYRFRGGVEFDRPILGIITNREEISKSHSAYGRPQINYKDLIQGGIEQDDKISLSSDRKSLMVDWKASPNFNQSRDQIRVLVESEK